MKREYTDPINPATPKQIGDVVGVDRMDSVDRQKLDPRIKLQLLAAETKATTGRDPRSGGFAIVARPRVVLQLLMDLKVGPFSQDTVRLQKAMVYGTTDSDVVGWWQDVPIIVRCTVVDDGLWCLQREHIPASSNLDRRQAGAIRMHAHNSRLEALRD